MRRNQTMMSFVSNIENEKCIFCDKNARHIIYARSILRGTRMVFVCDIHRLEWYNNKLDL